MEGIQIVGLLFIIILNPFLICFTIFLFFNRQSAFVKPRLFLFLQISNVWVITLNFSVPFRLLLYPVSVYVRITKEDESLWLLSVVIITHISFVRKLLCS